MLLPTSHLKPHESPKTLSSTTRWPPREGKIPKPKKKTNKKAHKNQKKEITQKKQPDSYNLYSFREQKLLLLRQDLRSIWAWETKAQQRETHTHALSSQVSANNGFIAHVGGGRGFESHSLISAECVFDPCCVRFFDLVDNLRFWVFSKKSNNLRFRVSRIFFKKSKKSPVFEWKNISIQKKFPFYEKYLAKNFEVLPVLWDFENRGCMSDWFFGS